MAADGGDACDERAEHVRVSGGSSIVKYKPLFSFDSKYLFVCCGHNVKVLSTVSGECLHNLRGHQSVVVGVQINPANQLQLLSCDASGSVMKWDYEDGVLLKQYKLNCKVSVFFAPKCCQHWYVVTKSGAGDTFKLCSVTPAEKKNLSLNSKRVLKRVNPSQRKITFGVQSEYVATISEEDVVVKWIKSSEIVEWNTGTRQLTCIAAHPTDYCLAVGDKTGRVVIWYGFLPGRKPVSAIHHWHTLPVADVTFSAHGSQFFSGGEECVLVTWRHGSGNSKHDRRFLPRMGMPISCITSSPDNFYVATCHVDNAIQLVNAHDNIVQVYQGLTQGHQWSQKTQSVGVDDPIPTGVLYDPRTKAVVMNGKPGHLQFYDISDDKQMYNLDVVGQNFITQERHAKIINTDVIKAAFDDSGRRLATVEYRNDGITYIELRLKFWKFDDQSQRFSLTTTIEYPHKEPITEIKFRPSHVDDHLPQVVTLSRNAEFKIWSITERQNTSDDKESWNCKFVGFYRSFNPTCSSFSEDGSLLAVAFNCVLTLWLPDSNAIKSTLLHPRTDEHISNVEFGRKQCCQYVAVATESSVTVWNILSLSICWHVDLDVAQLTADPFSHYMAVFTSTNKLFVFSPSDSSPVYVNSHIKTKPIHSAFVPHQYLFENDESLPWERRSRLVYVDSDQQLYSISCNQFNQRHDTLRIKNNIPKTPFGLLMAEKNKSKVETHEREIHLTAGLPGKKEIGELVTTPSHVLPPASALCIDFINSLLHPKSSSYKEKDIDATAEDMQRNHPMEVESEDDADASLNSKNVDSDESR